MMIGILLALCLLSVPLAGGRLDALADVRLRALWLVFGALALQVLIVTLLPGGSPALHRGVHLGTYLMLAAFVVLNRAVPYLWLAALGGLCNAIAIFANDGVMPASARALAAAGVEQDPSDFANSTTVAGAHLQFLGDVFAVPSSLPVSNVFSVGDVLLVLGALLALHRICGSRLPGRSRAAAAAPAELAA